MELGVIRKIVEAASWVPSGDNCQPFKFVWNKRNLEIHHLLERGKANMNVGNLASYLSLGMALENTNIAAGQFGYKISVKLCLKSAGSIWARVTFHPAQIKPSNFYEAIFSRCVNRKPYLRKPIPLKLKRELFDVSSEKSGANFKLVEEKTNLVSLASLLGSFDKFLMSHRGIHDDLYRWIRWTRSQVHQTQDGMSLGALELQLYERPGMRLLEWWPLAKLITILGLNNFLAFRAANLYRRSAAFGFLSVPSYKPEQFIRAGEVWQKIWLTLARRGFSLQPIAGISFMTLHLRFENGKKLSTRQQTLIRKVGEKMTAFIPDFKKRVPVIFFRIGKPVGPPTMRTVRLPLEKIFEVKNG